MLLKCHEDQGQLDQQLITASQKAPMSRAMQVLGFLYDDSASLFFTRVNGSLNKEQEQPSVSSPTVFIAPELGSSSVALVLLALLIITVPFRPLYIFLYDLIYSNMFFSLLTFDLILSVSSLPSIFPQAGSAVQVCRG